ncbi:phage tail spike protein [Sporosarcina saromensis]|uniref:Phage tail spike protein n=1 Tax=Sporosarcina saromensis TaxID=359365 RepID=A0ABU4G761_9BACL|nr:phage tail spike protein [Sporosarcina saromensis]MDW0112202.1 phage tail spike protein [Sporosarcina saromensis]
MALIHILDSQSDKIIGTLDTSKGQVIEPKMTRSIENFYTFTMTALDQFDKLTKRNRLLVQDADGFFYEFIIENAGQYIRTEKEVRSFGSFVDLQKAKVISPQDLDLTGATPASALTAALDATEWKPGIVEYTGSFRTIKLDSHTDPYSLLKLIASTFELEIRYRVEVKGNRIIGRFVDLVERIAGFEGKEIEYGKDLVGIRRVEDTSNIVTALLGLGPVREDGTRLEVFVEDKDALARWGRNGNHLIQVYEPTSTDEDMTEARLRSLTQTELKKRVEAIVTYECKAVSLEHVFGYEHERVRLGQTVRIKDDGYTPPLYLEARIRETVENIATAKVLDFKIGNYIEYSKADLEKQIAALKNTMSERLANMVYATVTSSSGTIFKNGVGSTTLTANALLSGVEFDADGTKYTYVWSKYDKNGYPVAGWSATGKTLTVSATDVDEKAMYMVSVSNDKINVPAQITISNVFDGADGTNGTDGKDGVDGVSVTSVTNYYLASASSSGVTTSTTGWTTAVQNPTSAKKYLWNYEKTTLTNGTSINTTPVIIGNYAADGSSGRGISNIVEYYQISNSNTVAPTSWVTTPPATTPTNKYLWNYERITYTDNTTSDTPKRVIGTHGETGATGADGADGKGVTSVIEEYYHSTSPTVLTGGAWSTTVPAWADGKYVWVRTKVTYTDNTSTTTDPVNVTGQTGANGVTTYSWRMYADDDKGTGISASPAGKRWIGWAHNKTSATPSNTPSDYAWSPLYDNVAVGVRNLLLGTEKDVWVEYINAVLSVSDGARTKSVKATSKVSTTTTFGIQQSIKNRKTQLKTGEIYTLSFLVRGNIESLNYIYIINTGVANQSIGSVIVASQTEFKKVSITFVASGLTGASTGSYVMISRQSALSTSDWFEIQEVKLEKGNVATDWTPAPEDVEQSIADAENSAKQHANTVSQAAYDLALADAKAYAQANAIMAGETYNGTSITNTDGVLTVRGDGLVRIVQNATRGFFIQRRANSTSPWVDVYFVDTNGKLHTVDGVFSGTITGSLIISENIGEGRRNRIELDHGVIRIREFVYAPGTAHHDKLLSDASLSTQGLNATKHEADGVDFLLQVPKIQTDAFITPPLSNGWVTYSASYYPAQYMIDPMGFVTLRGAVKNGQPGHVFYLPEGYRPSKQMLFIVPCGFTIGDFAKIEVYPSGMVTVYTTVTSRVMLDGIRFKAEA